MCIRDSPCSGPTHQGDAAWRRTEGERRAYCRRPLTLARSPHQHRSNGHPPEKRSEPMTYGRLSGVVSLVLTLASGVAAAATITTPALGAFGTNRLVCTVANIGSKDVDVTIQIVNQAGSNLVNLPITVAAVT